MKRYIKILLPTIMIASCLFASCATSDKAASSAPASTVSNDEYKRSTGNVNISVEEFNQDKSEILAIIANLDKIMQNKDYKSWLTYIDSESQTYWSKPANLQKAASKLPGAAKNTQLKSLEDYFKYVFIPSRVGKQIEEIRYETPTHVKAVYGANDTVYYNFKKVNEKWKINLPPID